MPVEPPCGLCHYPPPWGTTLSTVFVDGHGLTNVCTLCLKRQMHLPVAERTYFPPSKPVPKGFGNNDGSGDIPVCGICRQGLLRNDTTKAIRLTAEDLCEAFWDAYALAIAGPAQALEQTLAAARESFERDTAAQRAERDARKRKIETEDFNAGLAKIEQASDTQEEFDRAKTGLEAQRDAALNALEQEFLLETGPERAIRDAALFRAGKAYRAAAIAAYTELWPPFMDAELPKGPDGAPLVPGMYGACKECRERFTPRIRERLVRGFVMRPEHAVEEGMLI